MSQAGRDDPAKPRIDVHEIERRVERLLAALAEPPQVRARAEELVRNLMELYGEALARVVGLLDDENVARLAEDDLLASLLILHDLHPRTTAERIERALEQVLKSSGTKTNSAELVSVDEHGVARIRLSVVDEGCCSSPAPLGHIVEQAVMDAAPELAEVRVEETAGERLARGPDLLQIGFGPPTRTPAAPAHGRRG